MGVLLGVLGMCGVLKSWVIFLVESGFMVCKGIFFNGKVLIW